MIKYLAATVLRTQYAQFVQDCNDVLVFEKESTISGVLLGDRYAPCKCGLMAIVLRSAIDGAISSQTIN